MKNLLFTGSSYTALSGWVIKDSQDSEIGDVADF